MVAISAFRGVYYDKAMAGNLNEIISPPYDVLSEDDERKLQQRSEYNIVHLDLPKNIGREAFDETRYIKVTETYRKWRSQNILVKEPTPSIYRYDVEYRTPEGATGRRRGLVCLVKLEDFSTGKIKPHEKTFSTVIDDRFHLLRHSQVQLSQVFSLYSDPENTVLSLLDDSAEPHSSVQDEDGNIHTLYRVTDTGIITDVVSFFKNRELYIADGHHRYTTALEYKKFLEKSTGSFSANNTAGYVMMYLTPMEDDGICILPTHRRIILENQLDTDGFKRKFQQYFDIEEIGEAGIDGNVARMVSRRISEKASFSHSVFGVYLASAQAWFVLVLNENGRICTESLPSWYRNLDVAVLSELVINTLLGLSEKQLEAEKMISYFSSVDKACHAVQECKSGNGGEQLLFLLNATRVDQLKEVADNSAVMPHKSTFFYPKLVTGLVVNEL